MAKKPIMLQKDMNGIVNGMSSIGYGIGRVGASTIGIVGRWVGSKTMVRMAHPNVKRVKR